MKKNGFVFVETIIAIVILTSSLMLLYTSFNKILQSEKTRVYYDDVAYLYRSWYIKNKLNDLNIMSVLKTITNTPNKYFVTVGTEYTDLFYGYEDELDFTENLIQSLDVNQMVIIKENKLDELKKCSLECINNSSCSENCGDLYTNLSDEMISYIKTIFVDVPCTYLLVIEFNTCDYYDYDISQCKNYYSWVSV